MELSWSDPNLGINLKIVSVAAGADLSKKLLCLALRHYELASTTVTGLQIQRNLIYKWEYYFALCSLVYNFG